MSSRTAPVVIAAITSCTNTSNPAVMLAAGLVARNARRLGITVQPWVKTSLAPGSKVVTEYLQRSELLDDLEALGFNVVGYGCTTCIGNSGPLNAPISKAVSDNKLSVASVLSGNRNFEGRVHQEVRMNFLASPPLVVAYALAGTVDIDLTRDPLGRDAAGKPCTCAMSGRQPSRCSSSSPRASMPRCSRRLTPMFPWRRTLARDPGCGHRRPTSGMAAALTSRIRLTSRAWARSRPAFRPCAARVASPFRRLDHHGPHLARGRHQEGCAGRPVPAVTRRRARDFNSYGSRRGNHEVMMRGTFANPRIKNLMVPASRAASRATCRPAKSCRSTTPR
jgi:aconitate hydratase